MLTFAPMGQPPHLAKDHHARPAPAPDAQNPAARHQTTAAAPPIAGCRTAPSESARAPPSVRGPRPGRPVSSGPPGTPTALEPPHPIRHRRARKFALQVIDKRRPIEHAIGIGAKPLIHGQVRPAQRAAELDEQAVIAGRHHHVAVARGKSLIRHDFVHARPGPGAAYAPPPETPRSGPPSRPSRFRTATCPRCRRGPERPRSISAARMPITDHMPVRHIDDRYADAHPAAAPPRPACSSGH